MVNLVVKDKLVPDEKSGVVSECRDILPGTVIQKKKFYYKDDDVEPVNVHVLRQLGIKHEHQLQT